MLPLPSMLEEHVLQALCTFGVRMLLLGGMYSPLKIAHTEMAF